jgi:hypothetical protein
MARRPKAAGYYRRRRPVRDPYDLVLIVCEGEKTEPEYFRGLRRACQLSSANVRIVPSHYGNDPVSLVRFAIDKYREDKGLYSRMYCVFDRNGHAGYQDALDLVANAPLGKTGKLFATTSIPCFEVWVLLHFHYSTAAFTPVGAKSGCDRVIDAIKTHFPEYQKAFFEVFDRLHPNIDTAISNAQKLSTHNAATASTNPATRVHELVQYLRGLKP